MEFEGAALVMVTAVAAPSNDAPLTRHACCFFLLLLALETEQGGLHSPPLACTFLRGG
jgi:hypothetical protein